MTDSIHVACRHDLTTAGLNRQFLNMPGEMGGVGGLGGVIQLLKSKGVDKKTLSGTHLSLQILLKYTSGKP